MSQETHREQVERRVQRRRRRSTLALRAVLWSIAVFAAIGLTWRWKGEEVYRRWNRHRWLQRATAALAAGNAGDAATAAREVLRIDPLNVRAIGIMAQVADVVDLADALVWHRRLFELEGWNITNRITYAQTALRLEDYFSAAEALNGFPTNPPPPAFYYDAAGAVALGLGDAGSAIRHFTEALRNDAGNPIRQINLAQAEMRSRNEAERGDGRERLRRLAATPITRSEALRLLVEDAVQRQAAAEAMVYAEQLRQSTNANFRQRLAALAAGWVTKGPRYAEDLARMQAEAVKQPAALETLIGWMNLHDQAPAALAWCQSLNPEILKPAIVAKAHADTLVAVGDWLGLRHWCRSGSWGSLDALRLAYDTLAEQRQNSVAARPGQIDALWSRALAAAKKKTQILEALAGMAAGWGMKPQAETALWAAADSPYSPDGALSALQRLYVATDNSMGQFRVAKRILELRPSDPHALNNYVYFAHLLEFKDGTLNGRVTRLREVAGNNPTYLSTLAFVQFRKGDARGAADAMNAIPPEIRKQGAYAAMETVFLAAANDLPAARRTLALTEGAKLLPEERKLLEEARKHIYGR